jgi:hypothetical protein
MNDPAKARPAGRIRMTPEALKKAETYAQLVAEHFGAPYESIGFLLAEQEPPGPDPLITDVMLAHDQTVDSGSAQISPSGVLASGREIERKGKRAVGWWHAHPANTFHSGTDDQNLQTVLEDVSLRNRWSRREPQRVPVEWEDGTLVIRAGTETVRITGAALAALRPEGTGNGGAPEADLQAEVLSDALTESAAYSLVVSASGSSRPYAEMATRTRCAACGRSETRAQRVAIEVVDSDLEAMREEVRGRVRRASRHVPAAVAYLAARKEE